MTQLPWDRFPDDVPIQDVELPYVPPAPVPPISPPRVGPAPAPPCGRADCTVIGPHRHDPLWQPERPPADELSPEVKELASDLLNEAMSYARAAFGEIRKGQTVDVLNPTITGTTGAGRELVIADAKSRSWRTLIQGLAFDVMAAIVAAVALLSGADPFVKETWIAFGVLLLKSVVSAVISYFMRLKVTPTIRAPGERMAVMPIPRPMREEENTP